MKSLRGKFLISAPSLQDPHFHRTVVLLCEHGDEGALGLVVNRESPIALKDVLGHVPELEESEERLWQGGPVQGENIFILHDQERIGDSRDVIEGVRFGGDMDLLRQLLEVPAAERSVRLYAGYSGWGTGQLEAELKEDSWIICSARHETVFSENPEQLWSHLLLEMGGDFAIIGQAPDNPDLN